MSASFMKLVYREFALLKKSIVIDAVCGMIFYIMIFMVALSSRIGNLAAPSSESIAALKDFILPYTKYIGIYVSFILVMTSTNIAKCDVENKTWLFFRKSLPVSPLKLALAKNIYLFIMFVFSVIMSVIFIGIYSAVSGIPASANDFGVLWGIGLLTIFMVMTINICTYFTNSNDKGGMIAIGIMVLLVAVIMTMFKSDTANAEGPEALEKIAGWLADNRMILMIGIIAVFIIGTFFQAMVFKKRQK